MYPQRSSGGFASGGWQTVAPTVIVADDDPLFGELISRCIIECGFTVVRAADTMQTVMYAMQHIPAAIVLDINMPGGSGIAALTRLRQSVKTMRVPVIVVTGSTDPEVERSARSLGVTIFLQKPIEPDVLKSALHSVIPVSLSAS